MRQMFHITVSIVAVALSAAPAVAQVTPPPPVFKHPRRPEIHRQDNRLAQLSAQLGNQPP
jgi:hypothetical protein